MSILKVPDFPGVNYCHMSFQANALDLLSPVFNWILIGFDLNVPADVVPYVPKLSNVVYIDAHLRCSGSLEHSFPGCLAALNAESLTQVRSRLSSILGTKNDSLQCRSVVIICCFWIVFVSMALQVPIGSPVRQTLYPT